MREISIEPITPEAFAPFGEVLSPPIDGKRIYHDRALACTRPSFRPSLYFSPALIAAELPIEIVQMERHKFSSQSFVPMSPTRFLALVAPHGPDDRPDIEGARAFLVEGGTGVTYGADVWHHPLTVLDAPASFAVFMWREGGPDDEQFVDVGPFTISGS
jgi:ureidoglycolate lyase